MAGHWRATLVAGFGAVLFGTTLGFATVDGVKPQQVQAEPIYPLGRNAGPDFELASASEDCGDCAHVESGYRWASYQGVTAADQCFGDDASFQRGCLAYLRREPLTF